VNAILEQARQAVTELLHAHAHPLAEPVGARFLDATTGSTGVAVTVRLRDPARAPAARAVLAEHFGVAGVDVFDIR